MTKNKGVCTGADNSHRARLSAELVRRYHFLKRGVIGQSRCGREIEAFALGSEEESVLYCGAFHGMEWITSLLLYKYLDCVCAAADRGGCVSQIKLTRFLKRRGLVVIPCVNPDGVEISLHGAQSAGAYANLVSHVSGGKTAHWQANAAGVDLNHNYDAGWEALHKAEQKAGFVSPGPTRFGGKQPESEPETQAMCAFCRKNNIHHAVAFHSQGEEIYWHFGEHTPERAGVMATVMARSSVYKKSSPEGLAVGGGFKDWFITEFKRPAFTVEVGKGRNPLPPEDLGPIYDKIEEMLTLCLIM